MSELILLKSSSTFDALVTGNSKEFSAAAEGGMGVSLRSADGHDIGNATVLGLGFEWTVICLGYA
jgi:hypothetical protein